MKSGKLPLPDIKILAAATQDIPTAQNPAPFRRDCDNQRKTKATADPIEARAVTTSKVRMSKSSIIDPF